jgi:uncharacterized protein (TIGR03089 family)
VTAVDRASTVPALLLALSASDPGRPRLTWYDDANGPTRGERIELSARVLSNWVAKAANLLVDELDVEPGDRVVIDLPPHWRAVYWLLAAWSVGAEVVVVQRLPAAPATADNASASDARVLITDDPHTAPAGPTVVAVTLAALARGWDGSPLPDGVVDEAASVTGQPDLFEAVDPPDSDSVALRAHGQTVTYGQLLPSARAVAVARGWPQEVRVLTSSGPADAVAGLLAPLTKDGSVVLVREPDPTLLPQRIADERITG